MICIGELGGTTLLIIIVGIMFTMARFEGCNFVTLKQLHGPFCSLEEQRKVSGSDAYDLINILPMMLSVSLVEYKDKPHCATASFSLLIYHCFVPVLCKHTFSKGYQGMVGQQMLPILRHFKLRNTKVCMSGKHFFVVDLRVQKSELF